MEVNFKFGRKCVFRLERSYLGHPVRIRGGWWQWLHRTPQGDHLTYMQDIVAFILYRNVLQVWSKMCVSSGKVFSGPSSPHNARVVSLDSQNPSGGHLIYRQEIVAFILYRSELQIWSKMFVSSGAVLGPSSTHMASVVAMDSQNTAGGPFDICKKLSRLSYIEVYFKFGRKCMFRLERSSLGHQVRIRRGWYRWIHRTP